MNPTAHLVEHVIKSKHKDELSIIHRTDYNLAIWERNSDERITKLTDVMVDFLPTAFEAKGTPDYCIKDLKDKIVGSYSNSFIPIIEDMQLLCNWFSELSDCKEIRISLEFIDNDMCKIFHTDVIDLRLTCAYKGLGTVWTENSNINRKSKSSEDRLLNPDDIQFVQPFHVAIMKGALHDHTGAGAVFHRSPSIKESGGVRLLLKIETTRSFL